MTEESQNNQNSLLNNEDSSNNNNSRSSGGGGNVGSMGSKENLNKKDTKSIFSQGKEPNKIMTFLSFTYSRLFVWWFDEIFFIHAVIDQINKCSSIMSYLLYGITFLLFWLVFCCAFILGPFYPEHFGMFVCSVLAYKITNFLLCLYEVCFNKPTFKPFYTYLYYMLLCDTETAKEESDMTFEALGSSDPVQRKRKYLMNSKLSIMALRSTQVYDVILNNIDNDTNLAELNRPLANALRHLFDRKLLITARLMNASKELEYEYISELVSNLLLFFMCVGLTLLTFVLSPSNLYCVINVLLMVFTCITFVFDLSITTFSVESFDPRLFLIYALVNGIIFYYNIPPYLYLFNIFITPIFILLPIFSYIYKVNDITGFIHDLVSTKTKTETYSITSSYFNNVMNSDDDSIDEEEARNGSENRSNVSYILVLNRNSANSSDAFKGIYIAFFKFVSILIVSQICLVAVVGIYKGTRWILDHI